MPRERLIGLMAAVVAAGAFGACGGASAPSSSRPGDGTAAGKRLFSQRCAACHALADAKSNTTIGPNLDDVRPSTQRIEDQVRNGGGAMPAFESQLDDEQIRAVAAYVAEAARR